MKEVELFLNDIVFKVAVHETKMKCCPIPCVMTDATFHSSNIYHKYSLSTTSMFWCSQVWKSVFYKVQCPSMYIHLHPHTYVHVFPLRVVPFQMVWRFCWQVFSNVQGWRVQKKLNAMGRGDGYGGTGWSFPECSIIENYIKLKIRGGGSLHN